MYISTINPIFHIKQIQLINVEHNIIIYNISIVHLKHCNNLVVLNTCLLSDISNA